MLKFLHRKGTLLVTFSDKRLQDLFEKLKGKRIAVIGDVMLDRYYWGSITRVSPEAPVPIVEVESESTRLGGAANVAHNISSLGGIPVLIGVVGNDVGGKELRALVKHGGFPDHGIIEDSGRPTTVKTRVIAHHQHVVRIDHEVKDEVGDDVRSKILELVRSSLDSLDGIILEDYNKGVVSKELIPEVVKLARSKNKIITVDPKVNNFFEYKHVTVFKPNRKETEQALGVHLTDRKAVERAGQQIAERLEADHVLLTLGEEGMSLFERSGTMTHVPTRARKVADVSGAGDTVISTLTIALSAGASIQEAAALANFAGGVVCREVGIVPIERDALYHAVIDHEDQAAKGS